MFSAEAPRLAAIECLCPTAANKGDIPFPTLAGRNLFDSQAAPLSALDAGRPWTPVAALYTREVTSQIRGDAAAADDYEVRSVLEIVAELATTARDEQGEFADAALATGDSLARLTLAALVAQIEYILLYAEAGALFRSTVIRVDKIEEEPHAVPQLGLRWQRVFLRFHLVVPEDQFVDGAGLPAPTGSLAQVLPADSYARKALDSLASAFAGQTRTPLEEITIATAPDGDPIATTGDLTDG